MKYFIYIALILVVNLGCGTLATSEEQQQYNSYIVKKGDTAFSIAQKYGISQTELYRLNPDARDGVKENAVLIVPAAAYGNTEEGVEFKMHRVKKKETLFSISQLYNIGQDDIKRYNKELYARQLKKGEKIRIPVRFSGGSTTKPGTSVVDNNPSYLKKHTVKAKETKFGIARKYGITVAELEALNPDLEASLPIGTELNVPKTEVAESAEIDTDKYDLYEVQPKEGFYRLKVKLGLTEEEIVALNPYAKDGLKEGMILKIPKENASDLVSNVTKVNLEDRVSNKSKQKVAVLLPFRLNKIEADSSANNEETLRRDALMRIALDFYSGVKMAAEFAKDQGLDVELNVFDTEGSESKTSSIISNGNFKDMDAVIGPLRHQNVEKAAAGLRNSSTPVFSPLSNKEIRIYSNLFQTLPTKEMLEEAMLDYLAANANGKNIIVISDRKSSAVRDAVTARIGGAKTVSPREGNFVYREDIVRQMQNEAQNWVVLTSEDPVLVSNVVGLLNGMPKSYNVRLFALEKNDAYDYHDVSNMHLANLQFTFPSVNKGYDFNEKNSFLISYQNKYGHMPNKYAVRGFDLTYDVLLRLATEDGLFEATQENEETEYIENKFRYSKKLLAGYQNKAFYIIKFNKELQFDVVQ